MVWQLSSQSFRSSQPKVSDLRQIRRLGGGGAARGRLTLRAIIRHRSTIQRSFFSFLAPQIPLASHFRSCVVFHASASTLFHNSAATTFSLSQNFPHHTDSRNCQTSEVLRQSRRISHGLRPQRKSRTGPWRPLRALRKPAAAPATRRRSRQEPGRRIQASYRNADG